MALTHLLTAALAELLLQDRAFVYLGKQKSPLVVSAIRFAAQKDAPTKGITRSLALV